jgi:D-glycero-D-manno-heptose 1,7-bisphosphate phosphatase
MKRPAFFIDRDGTINEQMGYVNHVSRFQVLPGVPEAVRLLNENHFFAIVVSNQSGVARGYHPIGLVHELHAYLQRILKKEGAGLDGFFFCPHHPRGTVPEYTQACHCRKPQTGLIDQARESFDIDLADSYVVGDRHTDVQMAHRAGVRAIMVKTGYGLGEIDYVLPQQRVQPAHIAENLLRAVQWALGNRTG